MNVYGIYEDEQERFVNFQMDIFLNLQRIATVFKVEIYYQTKFTDIFQCVKNSLVQYDMDMNECDDHHFVFINDKGEEEQLFHKDWNQFVKDLNIFTFNDSYGELSSLSKYQFHTIKLEQTHGCLDTNQYKLEKMIGIKKDFMVKVIPSDELSLFEDSSRKLFVNGSKAFAQMSLEERLLIEHPIKMVYLKNLYQGDINISVYLDQPNTNKLTRHKTKKQTIHNKGIVIQASDTISVVIEKALSKFKEWSTSKLRIEDYLLRIAEREEYLVSVTPTEIIRFQYINSCVQMNINPNLILFPKVNLDKIFRETIKDPRSYTPKIEIASTNENAYKPGILKKKDFIYVHDLWKRYKKSCTNYSSNNLESSSSSDDNQSNNEQSENVMKDLDFTEFLYSIKISSIVYPPAFPKDQKIFVIAGLYHGAKSLCEHQYQDWSNDVNDCEILFPIEIWNLPRMTRLSFGLIVAKQSVSISDVSNLPQKKFVGWGNIMIYDHKSVIKYDTLSYRLWPTVKPNLNPTGTVYSNPDGDLITPLLKITLLPKFSDFKKIVYPPIEKLILEAGKLLDNELTIIPSKSETEKISEILSRSSIDDIMEDENDILWNFRYYIRDCYQQSLPRILNSRPWNNFENISKMQHLVCGWPIDKEIILALELLGSDFPDSDVRLIAVNSLSRTDWEEFSLYLLQICQCLKYEGYLNSNLTQLILKKMIYNAKIAQAMFYYLKVELSVCDWCKVPFSAILYNYLQYSPVRCSSLLQQYLATNEMCLHNKSLMQFTNLEGEKKVQILETFRNNLSSDHCKEIFENLTCPLDCNITLKTFNPSVCKFMDSKMRPILLSWGVCEEFSKDYKLIYKNGDDLRQDGLIIQMLHIMDSIWHRVGLNLKLSPYEVLACTKKEGYIQVVQKAETLANIYRLSKYKNGKIFLSWLQSKNHKNDMDQVVKNFTSSCAAYCVATFILGIGDRHSDNIMIREDGHFFHIDFGHILGNFKRIMGGMISREWTKFILVQDFFHIISNGDFQKELEFKQLCTKGYLALRKYSDLILSLFKIMVNTGIPEISNMDTLNYLKDTLQIGKSEEEAQIYFQNIYDDTLKKNIFISINWQAHTFRRVTN